jgi:hypothetical protein
VKRHRRRGGQGSELTSPSTEQLLEEWGSWLKSKRLSPEEAAEYRSVIIDFQRRSGVSDLTKATTEDIECYLDETDQEDRESLEGLERYLERTDLAEIDREDLEWLRGEFERLGEADPDPEH